MRPVASSMRYSLSTAIQCLAPRDIQDCGETSRTSDLLPPRRGAEVAQTISISMLLIADDDMGGQPIVRM